MNTINLKFEKSVTRLAGFPFGQATYKNQVREFIKLDGTIYELIFPSQIEKVASSFVQGFFEELINSIGYDEIEKTFIIKASSKKLEKNIKENIY